MVAKERSRHAITHQDWGLRLGLRVRLEERGGRWGGNREGTPRSPLAPAASTPSGEWALNSSLEKRKAFLIPALVAWSINA